MKPGEKLTVNRCRLFFFLLSGKTCYTTAEVQRDFKSESGNRTEIDSILLSNCIVFIFVHLHSILWEDAVATSVPQRKRRPSKGLFTFLKNMYVMWNGSKSYPNWEPLASK